MPPLTAKNGEPHPAWTVEAETDDYKSAAKFLISAVEPGASQDRVTFLARLLATRDYTKAELALVMKELPFDGEASHNYGKGLNPADVQRIVDENRELRARLGQKMTSEQRDELIAKYPKEIDADAFHCVDFDTRDNPLWKYAPHLGAYDRKPNSELEDKLPPKRERSGDTGLKTLSESTGLGSREIQDHMEGAAQQQQKRSEHESSEENEANA